MSGQEFGLFENHQPQLQLELQSLRGRSRWPERPLRRLCQPAAPGPVQQPERQGARLQV